MTPSTEAHPAADRCCRDLVDAPHRARPRSPSTCGPRSPASRRLGRAVAGGLAAVLVALTGARRLAGWGPASVGSRGQVDDGGRRG